MSQGRKSDESDNEDSLKQLASACITACVSTSDTDYLFDDVFAAYKDEGHEDLFLEGLEPCIVDDQITQVPPVVLKSLVERSTLTKSHTRLEEILCHLDPRAMDLDQVTSLCKANHLYDALVYVWSQGIGDFTTIIGELLEEFHANRERQPDERDPGLTIFPYLSYTLTGRIYPTNDELESDTATLAKAAIYAFLFSAESNDGPAGVPLSKTGNMSTSFPQLRNILEFDAASFFSMLNEAFEDPFLNGPQERLADETPGRLNDDQRFGLSINRQWIVSILLDVVTAPAYPTLTIVYLNMFIARSLPKFPQFILLPGHVLHTVLIGLCEYHDEDTAEDCELSVEYLLSLYQPPDLESLIPLLHEAHFFRVLKNIFRSEKRYPNLLNICFEDLREPNEIFETVNDCLRPGSGLDKKQKDAVHKEIVDHADEFIAAGVIRAASTIEECAPELHDDLLATLTDEDWTRYQYLRTILEPEKSSGEGEDLSIRHRDYVEPYVRLLCEYDAPHVNKYLDKLQVNDLNLAEVMPALEASGAIDAAVILLAKANKMREGIDRLLQHLQTLTSALVGLIDGSRQSPDVQTTNEAGQDMVTTVQRYVRIGIWICRKTSETAQQIDKASTRSKSPKAKSFQADLLPDEVLWLDLITTVVGITSSITERFEDQSQSQTSSGPEITQESPPGLQISKLSDDIKVVVQEAFTALLLATTPPRTDDTTRRADGAFLRILRAFLVRASITSPHLSNVRAVLGSIFAAYSNEESLLTLSNRLLDKDLFTKVTEADRLRRRGWRPLGQTCEACGRRVWGPGTGAYVWQAWRQQTEQRGHRTAVKSSSRSSSRESRTGKGKAVTLPEDVGESVEKALEETGADATARSPVLIFSCRHMFHRTCLDQMQDEGLDEAHEGPSGSYTCPLEAESE